MRGLLPVAGLMALAIAAGLWAVGPFRDLPETVPQEGGAAAGVGSAIAAVGILLLVAAAAALVWAVRKDLDRAVRLVVRAAIAFGLLLLLVRPVLSAPDVVPTGLAWALAAAAAITLAWLLRDGWPAQVAAALAAGGFAGMAAGIAGLAVLALVTAAIALYDAWAVRRAAMGRVAAAADAVAAQLTVGSQEAGLSLGLGDLLLPAALVAAAFGHGALVAIGGALGTAAGLVVLARVAQRADAPGIPYLAGGGLAGTALGLAVLWARPLVS